jgi:serine/threonine protein kinase
MRVCPRCSAIYRAQVLSCAADGATLVERTDDPMIGSQISRFTIEALHAEGTLGRIYRAKDVAIRILYGDFGSQEIVVRRCLEEAEAAKALQHPNTARILEVGSDDGSVFVAMELADGRTLDAWLAEEALDLGRAGTVLAQVAASLAEAHEADILHKNLAPRNVVVGRVKKRDVVKVLDFGLSSVARSTLARRLRTARDYAAPEAIQPAGATKASDVYSLGLLAQELIGRVGNGQTEVGKLVAEMVDPNPAKRPKSGREVLDRLDALGYSPLNLPSKSPGPKPMLSGELQFAISGVPMTRELATDLEADGLVVVRTSETPDVLPAKDGLVVALPGSAPATTTRYVYSGEQIATSDTAIEEIDVLESQKKLGFLGPAEDRTQRRPSSPGSEGTKRAIVLPRKPVLEKKRTSDPAARPLDSGNGADIRGIVEVRAGTVDPPPPAAPIVEGSGQSTEVSLSLRDRTVEVDLQSIVEVKPESPSQDLPEVDAEALEPGEVKAVEAVDPVVQTSAPARADTQVTDEVSFLPSRASFSADERTDEHFMPAVVEAIAPPDGPKAGEEPEDEGEPVPEAIAARPASEAPGGPRSAELEEILNSADLEKIEDAPFDRPAITVSSAADLIGSKAVGGVSTLPTETKLKPRASWPTADLVLPAKAEPLENGTVRNGDLGVPDRAGALESRAETMIIRPRLASRGRAPTAIDITDRASETNDPAEDVFTGELVRPTRSWVVPILVGAAILAVTAGALVVPRLGGRDTVERPVLIEAKAPEEPDLPEGDAPPEAKVDAPAIEPPPVEPIAEVEAPPPVVDPDPTPVSAEKASLPEGDAPAEDEHSVEADPPPVVAGADPADDQATEAKTKDADAESEPEKIDKPKKKPKKKRPRAKAAKTPPAPDKLERGTLIDPFAE